MLVRFFTDFPVSSAFLVFAGSIDFNEIFYAKYVDNKGLKVQILK